MKFGVILNGDLNAPHLKIYTNILDSCGISYDVISWDRSNNFKKSEFTFSHPSSYHQSMLKSLCAYVKFAKFIKNIINKYKYDKLIVISPQVALFIPFFLKHNYKKKYIFDYRDLSIEQKKPFKPLLKMVLSNSFANVISSPGFKQYLPKGFDYILSHNFDIKLVQDTLSKHISKYDESVIKVLTIGAIRYDANYEVIDSLGNVEGVELSFVGKGGASPVFENYCKNKGFENILFKGFYNKEDEGNIIKEHTCINIFYPNWPSHVTALSNRFYNSLIFKRPMIVTKGGTQGLYAEKYGVGLAVDNCEGLAEKIEAYIKDLDFDAYAERCNSLLKEFEKDYEKFLALVNKFIEC